MTLKLSAQEKEARDVKQNGVGRASHYQSTVFVLRTQTAGERLADQVAY